MMKEKTAESESKKADSECVGQSCRIVNRKEVDDRRK